MPNTLDLCEELFKTRDVYDLFTLTKDSLEKDIKKAYYRLSLKFHPDRVDSTEKAISTKKFQILSKLYQVLTDSNKKALYDEQGIIDDEDDDGKLSCWLELWRKIFKPISEEDIDKYQKEYIDSELEKQDIKKAYLNGKGCINYMMNCVPFMSIEDEPRIEQIVRKMIDSGEIPEYTQFTNEQKAKKTRRHKKYAKEREGAEKIKAKLSKSKDSLQMQIEKRQHERGSFFDQLLAKYGGPDAEVDDGEEFVPEKLSKTKKREASSRKARNGNVPKPSSTNRKVRNGRVTKKK